MADRRVLFEEEVGTSLTGQMFSSELHLLAEEVLQRARAQNLRIATAESCTGGLAAALLTEIAGASDVFERGFVTYSNDAKSELLAVPATLVAQRGAVSEEVARAMAEGAVRNSRADVAFAITGVAGPGGGSADKPVGLVFLAAARTGRETRAEKHLFGDLGRAAIRLKSVEAALRLLQRIL